MKEIRELTGNGLPYRSREELVKALSSHFDILHSEEELISLSFDNPLKVLYHLKQTGVTGISGTSSQQLRTRRDLQLFSERYTQEFTQGTSVSLTYHPIYIIAKRKSMKQNVYFVSGIDTDAGKSYATGFLAREWNKNGQRTITQKFIQTGNIGHSEDIDLHRRIMGISFTEEDKKD